jgi:hypothetical protein
MDPYHMDESFAEVKEAYNSLQRTVNGGRLITPESVAAFDADINDGDSVVTVDGKKLRIVESDSEAGEGKISRTRIKEIRAAMESQARAYEKGLLSVYDGVHARVTDLLLNENRIEEAREYLLGLEAGEFPSSPMAFSKIDAAVRRVEKVIETRNTATRIGAEAVEAGGQSLYGSPEQDADFERRVQGIEDSGVRELTRQMYASKKREQASQLMVDAHTFIKEKLQTKDAQGRPVKLPLDQQRTVILKMEEGPLKDFMLRRYKAQVAALDEERNSNPGYVLYMDRALAAFSQGLSQGIAKLPNGTEITLDKDDNIATYLSSLGLTRAYMRKALAIKQDSENSIKVDEITRLFKSAAGRDANEEDMRTWVPFLWRLMEDRRGSTPLGEKRDRNEWLRQNFAEVVSYAIKEDYFWSFGSKTIKKALEDDTPTSKVYYFTPEQLEEVKRGLSPSRLRKLSGDKKDTDEYWRGRYGAAKRGVGYYLWDKKK